MNLRKSLLAATIAVSAIANAQEKPTFSLSGEFRPRSEYFGAGQSATALEGSEGRLNTSVRAALNATYKSEGYTAYLGIQEVFSFGDRRQILPTNNGNIRVQEAWADIKLGEYSSLKIGRQPISYDDQRIFGGLGWAQQARTHDAAIFKFSKDGYNLDLGGSLSSTAANGIYNTSGFFSYRDMGFLRVNKTYDAFNISLLGLVTTQQDLVAVGTDDKASLITAGLHADYSAGIVKLSANAYLQDGDRIFGGAIESVESAYLASLDAVIKATDKVSVLAGIEAISGADDGSYGFFPLYGTNHKFNGLMDRFYVGNHARANGLVDANVGLSTSIQGYGLTVKGHSFSEESGDSDNLGSEVDLVVKKKFKGFVLVAGYSQFFEGDNEPATAKDTQAWAWAMLVFKPKFL